MPTFAYQVRNKDGKKVTGVIEAPSERVAADMLARDGYLIRSIKQSPMSAPARVSAGRGGRISSDDLAMVYFQLSNLVEAGIPLFTSLQTVMSTADNRALKRSIQDLISRIENGASFSEAMSHQAKTFPLLYRTIVRSGETSGSLAEALRHVAELTEASSALGRQIRSALAYPMVLIAASLAVITFMLVWIVPTFTKIFSDQGVPLPFPTRVLYGISLWVKAYPWLLAGILIAPCVGCPLLLRLPAVKYVWDRFWLSVPTLGSLIRRIEVARWSRSVALMISNGVPILQTLEVTQTLTQNLLFQETLAAAYTAVQGGEKFADTLAKSGVFPNDVVQMVATGENSGTLDKMLYKTANFYDQLISRTLKKVTAMIEPLFILFMGGVVAFIMCSILLPIFDMLKIFAPH